MKVLTRIMELVAIYAVSCVVILLIGVMAKYYWILFSFGWNLL